MKKIAIPASWVSIPFTDILDISGGTQPPKKVFVYEPQEGYIRLLQIRDFGKKPVPTYIPNTGKLRLIEENDVSIARYGASIGRILTGHVGAINVAIAKVKIPNNISRGYIYWLLKSHIFQSYIRSLQRTAKNGFNKTDLGNLPIPLPPLAEQNRIVEKLDKFFGHLDVLNERLDKIPKLLKDFRQSVLSQAVSGELTAAWREGKTKRWSTNKLSELVITLNQGWSPKCYNYPSKKENVWGVIKTTSVQPMKYLEEENKELPSILKAREQHELSSGELLITRAGPRVRVGICCLVRKTRKRLMICDKVYRLVLNQDVVLPEFIEINLNSPETQYEIEAMKTGTSESGLNLTQGKIKELELEVPPPLEQKEIVRRVESLFVKADTIEQRYTALKEKINHLPKALLAKAFRGELMPQLPGDGDARELLEEIRKVREEMSGKK